MTRLLIVLALPLTACGADYPVCTSDIKPVLNIAVVDAETGSEVCDASLLVRDGEFLVELTTRCSGSPSRVFTNPPERVGTYAVTASHPNYLTQTVSRLVVADAECHVTTQDVVMELPVAQ